MKRLAMHVEDHPVEYGTFEGIIPHGEYGGGTVMLWDRGEWEPVGDAREGYRKGRLKFILHGEKLHGGWMLVRTGATKTSDDERREWLLFKERDAEAKPMSKRDILADLPLSVVSGRSLDQIEIAKDKVWRSDRTTAAAGGAAKPRRSARATNAVRKPKVKTRAIGENETRLKQLAGVRFTRPDKVLYPEQGITKLELASYYLAAADWIMPHLEGRLLVFVRCPEGRGKECFYQKHPSVGTPDAFRLVPVKESKKTEDYVVVEDLAGLISIAQIGALEVHAWGARADKLERPDRLVFDLDPDAAVPWSRVVESARQVRQFLEELGLESFLKTTGGKGLHLVAPIERRFNWDEVKAFCKGVAEAIATADPAHYTANMSKAARPGKIFIDYLRNGRGATAVAPYSTRARPGAPISVPIAWDELSPRLKSDPFTIRNISQRLGSLKRDPWKGIESVRQRLTGPVKRLREFAR